VGIVEPALMLSESAAMAGLEVLGEIGRGAQAVVDRVRRGDTEYAMRVLHAGFGHDPAPLREFRRQTAPLACVRDPALARVHAVGMADGRPYALMDLLEGERLGLRLSRGSVDEKHAVAIGADLAAALAVNLMHRDIKPDNILLAPSGAARLIDFGLAGLAGADADEPGQVVGTLTYSPPSTRPDRASRKRCGWPSPTRPWTPAAEPST
jgi:serine/threonine protein kinase